MTAQPIATGPSIRLPATLAIGFTGHRALPDESKSRKLIFDFLRHKKEAAPGMIYGISSVAAGADLLFAETCVELEIPIHVLLPMPAEEFRADFNPADWARAEQVVRKAFSVEVTGGNQPRAERYYECGIETVLQSGLLVALWNGEPSQGMGGTEDIVSFARGLDRPVVWFNSVTGDTQVFNERSEANLLHDPELDYLNSLPDPRLKIESDEPLGIVQAWFDKMDENANQSAPQLRRLAAIPIICTAAAALCTGGATYARNIGMWLAIGTVLGVMAAVLPAILRLRKRQSVWARTRMAAELTRSVMAFWDSPFPYQVIGPEVIPELSGALISLNVLKMRGRSAAPPPVEEFKSRYRQDRVGRQIAYFSRHSAQSADEVGRYQIAIKISIAAAVLATLWLYIGPHAHLNPGHWKRWLALGASAAFQTATVAGALLVVNDCARRLKRYREMHYLLTEWDVQLKQLRTWSSVMRVATRIERALLVEVIEWRSVIRDRKLPTK